MRHQQTTNFLDAPVLIVPHRPLTTQPQRTTRLCVEAARFFGGRGPRVVPVSPAGFRPSPPRRHGTTETITVKFTATAWLVSKRHRRTEHRSQKARRFMCRRITAIASVLTGGLDCVGARGFDYPPKDLKDYSELSTVTVTIFGLLVQ